VKTDYIQNRHTSVHPFHPAGRKDLPRADGAIRIASALQTTVEFPVSGSDKASLPCTPTATEKALVADKFTDDGKQIVLAVLNGLVYRYPKSE
jgi:hypothetical protein